MPEPPHCSLGGHGEPTRLFSAMGAEPAAASSRFFETEAWTESANSNTMIAEKIPMQKEQTPEDVADTVAFFVSDDAKNITGQALNVDGGFYMR